MIRAALLQQTRLSDEEHKKLEQGFCYYAYSLSQRSGHCRDLAILISQQICFEYLFDIRDREIQYVLVKWRTDGFPPTTPNIYATIGMTGLSISTCLS